MKRCCAGLLCAALLTAAQADDAAPLPAAQPAPARQELVPRYSGYAFDQPDVLIRQRLFGLAHGVSLLAAACLDLPEHSAPIQEAYAAWHAQQRAAIETIVVDLSRYYFGPRAEEAEWPDLSRALNLANSIQPALSEVTLHAACASLPVAIGRPRYALDKLLTDTPEAEATDAVIPAPTVQRAAE